MNILIVYHTRTGTTEKAARFAAERLRDLGHGVSLEPIREETERPRGFSGWLSAGKEAFREKASPILPLESDLSGFDLCVVGTPVWAWNMTPAARAFLQTFRDALPAAALFCTMEGSGGERTIRKMSRLLRSAPAATAVFLRRDVLGETPSFKQRLDEFCNEALRRASP